METREMKLERLKTRIGSSGYEVDADAVAQAIVQRLFAARGEVRTTTAPRNGTGKGKLEPAS
jgi:hypothetical protein